LTTLVWAHRWEHDKNPKLFFDAISTINDDFRLSVLGESFQEVPECFQQAKEKFKTKILNWGYLEVRHS